MNEDGLRFFTDREKGIYSEWKDLSSSKPLAVTTSLKMYELFLNGYSCEEISRLNEHKFPTGMILDARLRHTWDDRRQQHLAELYGGIFDRVRQTQTEAVAFVSDLLSAAHKKHGDKLKKYLQSGEQADLDKTNLAIDTMTSYKTAADMLMKLTGQDKEKTPITNKTVVVGNNVSVTEERAVDDGGVVTSNIADRILQFLEAGEPKKK